MGLTAWSGSAFLIFPVPLALRKRKEKGERDETRQILLISKLTYLLTYFSDQVIRENSASRGSGTETSAEELVGPPWRMAPFLQ